MPNDLDQRRRTYATVGNAFAQMDDRQLTALLAASDQKQGWGGTHVVKVGGARVFVKKIPLTSLELEQPFSTANLYEMPTYYNYGVGSAGFGANRELVAHVKTTNWVLSGTYTNFPLMYHYRIVPFIGDQQSMEDERRRGYIDYWGGSSEVERYIIERGRATHQIVLCLEYFPHVAYAWLPKNARRWQSFIQELIGTARFMRDQGMIHFDIHFANVVLRDDRPYVADFGLVADKSFHLSETEKRYLSRHIDYDLAYIPSAVGSFVYNYYRNASETKRARLEKRYGVSIDDWGGTVLKLVESLDDIHSAGLLKLDDYYAQYVIENRELILTMQRFFQELRRNPKKDTPYPHVKVKNLIHASGPTI